jgi:SAM-dependent MidA family methyltransferase
MEKQTFAQFMQTALSQYYAEAQVGRDFITSVSVSKLFGEILARYFKKTYEEMGCPQEFEIVELGGHRGQLKQDILAHFPCPYRLIEMGDALPERICGVVFSNEFFDALPVHRVQVSGGAWREIYVDKQRQESLGELSDPRLLDVLAPLPVAYMEGYQTEVNLLAQDWLRDIAKCLERGIVLSIDYGFEYTDYYSPYRPQGTLRCYYQHTMNTQPYERIGAQDITADVEFSTLIKTGEACDLKLKEFLSQEKFLLTHGLDLIMRRNPRVVAQLTHPGLMGRAFKVLIQEKNRAGPISNDNRNDTLSKNRSPRT